MLMYHLGTIFGKLNIILRPSADNPQIIPLKCMKCKAYSSDDCKY